MNVRILSDGFVCKIDDGQQQVRPEGRLAARVARLEGGRRSILSARR
jgi:hypothetical protein